MDDGAPSVFTPAAPAAGDAPRPQRRFRGRAHSAGPIPMDADAPRLLTPAAPRGGGARGPDGHSA
jgi:hypothetical protein